MPNRTRSSSRRKKYRERRRDTRESSRVILPSPRRGNYNRCNQQTYSVKVYRTIWRHVSMTLLGLKIRKIYQAFKKRFHLFMNEVFAAEFIPLPGGSVLASLKSKTEIDVAIICEYSKDSDPRKPSH